MTVLEMIPKKLKKFPDAKEQRELTERIRKGDRDAWEEMIVRNLPLAHSIAAKFKDNGVDLEDLVQAASMGLMKAVERFNPKISRFATYATWWIRQSIMQEFDNTARTIRIPSYMIDATKQYFREYDDITEKNAIEFLKRTGKKISKDYFLSGLILQRKKKIDVSIILEKELEELAESSSDETDDFIFHFNRYMKNKSEDVRIILSEWLFKSTTNTQIGKIVGYSRKTVRQILKKEQDGLYEYLVSVGHFNYE